MKKSRKKNKPRLVFFISGRGSNMKAILKKIQEGKLKADPVLVFSDNPQAKGLEIAKKYGIETKSFSPKDFTTREEYEVALRDMVIQAKADLVVCAGYMRILKQPILQAMRGRIVNIHPSLLPAFPGLKAQKQALDYGVKFSGCTVHFVDEGVDTGPIIDQRVVPVKKNDTVESLSKRILKQEHDLYWRSIRDVLKKLP
ncbi:MAG: phosphoribosylglycinamide formyltransferase [Candidatus Hydrogenedentota bacterium]|nr:MAG: phosphoribosylglycinamide formyltransferase [Candidatus Hydrogenedentota bacterium]